MSGPADHPDTLTLDQLIDLLEDAHLHPPETVVAAWAELDRRGVPRREILQHRRDRASTMELHKRTPRVWMTEAAPLTALPRPRTNDYPGRSDIYISTESILTGLTILMGLLACLQIYGLFFSGLILLRPAESVDPITLYITLVGCGATVFCLLAALRLWQRRRIGWVLTFAYLLFQWLTPVWEVIRYTLLGTTDVQAARTGQPSWYHSVELFLVGSLLYGPALYFLVRPGVRKLFNVREGAAVRTLLVTCAVLVAFKLLLFGG
ncbi:hypothetical protein [Lewinella sp. IMCC34191]|uniref:hypothetical protein n=1 Tax=Lewinella sp. IMCC34191 TaxID=2259172 RepID=UPI000E251954|nr:hypothetical protein [Lewinella sp. IMCC34191]